MNLEQRLRRIEEQVSKKRKVNEAYGEVDLEYLLRNGKFGEYEDSIKFGSFEAATKASKSHKDSQVEEDTYGNFMVYQLASSLPWKTKEDLLESIVYRLEKEWSGSNYDIIEAAFKPSVAVIFKRLKDTEFDNLH